MKDTDPIKMDKADTKEDACNQYEEHLDTCDNGMLTSEDVPMTLANESLSQKEYQKLIADYYFGELSTHAKLLYLQIMSQPRRYGQMWTLRKTLSIFEIRRAGKARKSH
jgi:hypothetical protein